MTTAGVADRVRATAGIWFRLQYGQGAVQHREKFPWAHLLSSIALGPELVEGQIHAFGVLFEQALQVHAVPVNAYQTRRVADHC